MAAIECGSFRVGSASPPIMALTWRRSQMIAVSSGRICYSQKRGVWSVGPDLRRCYRASAALLASDDSQMTCVMLMLSRLAGGSDIDAAAVVLGVVQRHVCSLKGRRRAVAGCAQGEAARERREGIGLGPEESQAAEERRRALVAAWARTAANSPP